MDLNSEFPLDPELCYLNHAAVAPWPRRAAEAVARFAQDNGNRGAADYERWLETEQTLRQRLARLINAPSTRNIALQKNTSEGLSAIAWGLDWHPGDCVVISDQEFPSNRIVWESLQRLGVQVVEATLATADPEQSIIDAMDGNTRLLSVSSVQYGTGLALDLVRLGEACRERGVLFCVDAIQSLGALPFDVSQCRADFVVADGHKWMLGPEGVALFYVAEPHLERLQLHQFGWHMVRERGNYDIKTWTIASDAKRFECGSPNMLGIHGLEASLALLEEIGGERILAELMTRVGVLEQLLREHPELELITVTDRPLRSGILTFRHRTMATPALFKHLRDQQVVCAPRGGGIRFSPHFYTPLDVLERAVSLIPGKE
ncbi:MAG TPA: aminotransferase class V-fold PLP-dependent enzyme [Candidatus Kapabacteria bacterium]|nr:aminotransferase class V-fold PLP-dependent enzyme [Candidatus Kapabacteria bacterium]